MEEIKLLNPVINHIDICLNSEWVMRITQGETGAVIQFNTEKFPDLLPDDFANRVAQVLCKSGYLDPFYEKRKPINIETDSGSASSQG